MEIFLPYGNRVLLDFHKKKKKNLKIWDFEEIEGEEKNPKEEEE